MFNRSVYFGGGTNIKVNAVSGGIVKNHPDSYFRTFHLNSELARTLLSSTPYYQPDNSRYRSDKKYVEVLQMVVVGDMQIVAEIIELPEEIK